MSFWKKLAKIAAVAAPIVAAPFTGGASLALIGAGAGAASGALNGGGLKGTLLGAGLGAATGGFGGGGAAASGASNVAKSGMMSTLGKTLLKNAPELVSAAGSGLAAHASDSAHNRGVGLEAKYDAATLNETQRQNSNTANHDRDTLLTTQQKQMQDQLMAREVEGRLSGNDAYANTLRTDYALNRKPMQAATVMSNGQQKQLPTFGGLLRPELSAEAKAGMQNYRGEMMNRMMNGNQAPMPGAMPTPTAVQTATPYVPDPKLMQPGMFEKIAGIVGPGMETFAKLQNRQTGMDEEENQRLAGQVEARYGSA